MCQINSLAAPRAENCSARTLRAVFALLRTQVCRGDAGVHTNVNAARTSACATSIRYSTARIAGGLDTPPIVITMGTVGGGEKRFGTCTLIWKTPDTDPGAEPA